MSKFITIETFDDPVTANISKGKLESEGIFCFLRDENITSLIWLYNIALGGIKLCVLEKNVAKALNVLEIGNEAEEITCPTCNSNNIKESKTSGWITGLLKFTLLLILDFLFLIFFRNRKKIVCDYGCRDCGTKFTIEWN